MSICASGASTTKPGTPPAVVVDQAYVQSLLPAALSWLYPYLPFMHGLQIGNVGSFCAVDPPSWSVPTGPQLYSFITGGDISQAMVVSNFLSNITQAYLWYALCQCSSGAAPPALTPPAAPSGNPSLNPPAYVGPATQPPCAEYAGTATDPGSNLYVSVKGSVSPTTGAFISGVGVPAGATSYRSTYTVTPGAGAHTNVQFRTLMWNLAGAFVSGDNTTYNAGHAPITVTGTIGTTVAQFTLDVANAAVGPVSSDMWSVDTQFYCGGALPGQAATACCPPDPIATGLLNQILDIATLVQRQLAPFAYISSTAHAGLSGVGTIAVQGILGLRVDLTTVPARLGETYGDPVTLWDAGWINLGTGDGFGPRVFITSNPMLVRPVEPDVTVIGYSIPSDITVTITELVREP